MGYCIYQQETRFRIEQSRIRGCLDALKRFSQSVGAPGLDEQTGDPAEDLARALDHWGWNPEADEAGNIVSLQFVGEKLRDDHAMFQAIGPFVTKGSYIYMAGEDFLLWRWYFDGKTCHEEEPDYVYPNHG